MEQTYISSVSSDNLSKENICGWIINPLLMQKWGEAPHFFLADLTSYKSNFRYDLNLVVTEIQNLWISNFYAENKTFVLTLKQLYLFIIAIRLRDRC